MKMRKMTPQYKENVIKALDIFAQIRELGSQYYWLFEDHFRISDRHAEKYDEVSEDITGLFLEGIGYKELYNHWNSNLPFFEKHPKYGGFLVDAIGDVIHGKKELTAIERFEQLNELFTLALYLRENPLKKNSRITDKDIEKSKDYSTRAEKAERIKTILVMENVKANVIDEVMAMVRA